MKNRYMIMPLLFILIAMQGCLRDHQVVDPVELVDYKQYGIYLNASFYHPHGLETLIINEGDTLRDDHSHRCATIHLEIRK